MKKLRQIVAGVFFCAISLYFIDFLQRVPAQFNFLAKIQLIPALLAGSVTILLILLLLSLLFGRVYCSVICPSGILQDLFSRLHKRFSKGNKKKQSFSFAPPNNFLRYSILGLSILFLLVGSNQLLSLFDPYSIFGRIIVQIIHPISVSINNGMASLLSYFHIYSVFHVSYPSIAISALLVAVSSLLILGVMSYLYGRLFCNTICPVGSLLSLISRFSFFKINIQATTCNSCGACERQCKAQCIDSQSKTVDHSRCVTCFNCLSKCTKNSIHYQWAPPQMPFRKLETVTAPSHTENFEEKQGRRKFIASGVAIAGSLPLLPAFGSPQNTTEPIMPLLPPGALHIDHFQHHCTACHLCIQKCPNHIIKAAGFTYGWNHLLKPHLQYDSGYCNYECTICSDVCPNKAIIPLTKESKKTTQIGIAHFDESLCVTIVDGTDCGACSEHCPTQAVKMLPREGLSVLVPKVFDDICVGCGGCEYICPVRPVRAIRIIASKIQHKAVLPVYEEVEKKNVDGFGF